MREELKIICLPLGRLATNCYVVADKNGRAAVIDPACEGEKIISVLEKNRFTLEAILLTHAHFDHIMAIDTLFDYKSDIRVYLHAEEEPVLRDAAVNLSAQATGVSYSCGQCVTLVGDGEIISVGEMKFEVLHTPGHTVGSVCYLLNQVLFSGDTLFAGTVGRTDFPGGNYTDICMSIARLAHLEGDLRVLPGHEEETTMENERKHNPYLKTGRS
jgi:Zn-dependent hydrolases, including glyoxylases